MPSLPNLVVAIAILAVAVALALGFANLLRHGTSDVSQRLMRWRVGLQLLAVVLVVIILLIRLH